MECSFLLIMDEFFEYTENTCKCKHEFTAKEHLLPFPSAEQDACTFLKLEKDYSEYLNFNINETF
ncbi:hypothetical protein A6K24_06110 [Metabacillus litoralis]|uniref:Uncharacterized protein n=1 Tax=Metabacillus litoralis TaxID=152268 RepID=A0A179SXS1_9BACI|nr:hypothetical protein A6K24_06110 [Metabacillus litoralis]